MAAFVLSLEEPAAELETVGGKGMSLARLARAGLPVPDGFHLTTEAYRQFVAENGLAAGIQAALQDVDPGDPQSLEAAAGQIGLLFARGKIPPAIAQAVTQAYAPFADAPVAVRSSATAEDLPGASFAGQQDTYLNVRGAAAVLEAVQRCWASLWTARAIAYRARQQVSSGGIALAVVVQKLVLADAAGVMFTANPVNGRRCEVMITAAWGLGEAIVSGAVTPDTLVLDKSSGKLLRRETADKQVMSVRTASGTLEQSVPPALRRKPVLRALQAAWLVRLGCKIEQLYGMPMDIEWTLAETGQFAIVQARPITSLPEPPLEWPSPYPKSLMVRGSFAEFLPDPVSPLFATLALPIARVASVALMRDALGIVGDESYLMTEINGYVYIGITMTFKNLWPMLRELISQARKMLTNSTQRWQASRDAYLKVVAKWQARIPGGLPASVLLEGVNEIFTATADHFTVVQASVIPAATSSEVSFSRFYNSLVKGKRDPAAGTFLIGLDTQALRSEKALFDLASWIETQPELAREVGARPGDEIARRLALPVDGSLWDELRARFSAYLDEYGRAIYDLDFAKPLPADEPAPLLEALKTYLGGGSNPYLRQQAAEDRRVQAVGQIAARLDPLRRKWFLKLLKWAQASGPYREDGIAALGLGYPALRRLLGELGRRLVECGAIAAAGDVYWLEVAEAAALAGALDGGAPLKDHAGLVEQRKARWARVRCAQAPMSIPEKNWLARLAMRENRSDSRIFLKGYGASVGTVTAPACVMLGPEDFSRMRKGDVIVAVTTTPAWTPLFALAAGVVTDIGGPLSHSSIVAREYGIPAVMATSIASRRIQNGQTITVDGTAGTVTLN